MTKYWSATQHLVAGWFAEHGWPLARAVGSGRQGIDIENMPGLAPEVKSGQKVDMPGWMRQAASQNGLPFVVYRPHGFGLARLPKWPVVVELEVFTELLRAAGYGDDNERV
jgi:hypothetical protein